MDVLDKFEDEYCKENCEFVECCVCLGFLIVEIVKEEDI